MKYSIAAKTEHKIKIQRSEFIGFLFPVQSMDEVQEILKEHQQTYADATHNCYAYRIGADASTVRSSDDGEPAGTAGVPILSVLTQKNLVNALCVVTRYFGGILLGAGGFRERGATPTLAVGARPREARRCPSHRSSRRRRASRAARPGRPASRRRSRR